MVDLLIERITREFASLEEKKVPDSEPEQKSMSWLESTLREDTVAEVLRGPMILNDLSLSLFPSDMWSTPEIHHPPPWSTPRVSNNAQQQLHEQDAEKLNGREQRYRVWKAKPVRIESWVPRDKSRSSLTKIPMDVMTHALLFLDDSTLWKVKSTCKLFKGVYFRQTGVGPTDSHRILFLAAQGYSFPRLQRLMIKDLQFPAERNLVNEDQFPMLREVGLANCIVPSFCSHPKVTNLRIMYELHDRMLALYPNLTVLAVTKLNLDLSSIAAKLPRKLRELILEVTGSKGSDWHYIGKLTDLRYLSIWIRQKANDRPDAVVVDIPPTLQKLRDIALCGLQETPNIPSLPLLEKLTLEKVSELTLGDLPTLPSLKFLDLWWCNMNLDHINILETKFPALESLLLDPWERVALNLNSFPALPSLRSLTLGNVHLIEGSIGDWAPHLVRVTLNNISLKGVNLSYVFRRCRKLFYIKFRECRFGSCPWGLTFEGVEEAVFDSCYGLRLKAFTKNETLKRLSLCGCHIARRVLRHLAKFPNLEELDLSKNKGLNLKHIPPLHCLKSFSLVSCNLKDSDLRIIFRNLPQLVTLDLSNNGLLRKPLATKLVFQQGK